MSEFSRTHTRNAATSDHPSGPRAAGGWAIAFKPRRLATFAGTGLIVAVATELWAISGPVVFGLTFILIMAVEAAARWLTRHGT